MSTERLVKTEDGYVDLTAIVRLRGVQSCPGPPYIFRIVATLAGSGDEVRLAETRDEGGPTFVGPDEALEAWAARVNAAHNERRPDR